MEGEGASEKMVGGSDIDVIPIHQEGVTIRMQTLMLNGWQSTGIYHDASALISICISVVARLHEYF